MVSVGRKIESGRRLLRYRERPDTEFNSQNLRRIGSYRAGSSCKVYMPFEVNIRWLNVLT